MLDDLKKLFTEFSWDNPIMVAIIRIAIITVAFIVAYFLLNLIVKGILRITRKKKKRTQVRANTFFPLIKEFIKYTLVFVYILAFLQTIGVDTTSLIAGAGIVGVVCAFAFQDLLNDVVAGVMLVVQDVFDVGDYIEVNGYQGTVLKISLKTTVIRSYTGEICTLNNRTISNVRNYTKAENALTITFFRLPPTVDIEDFYQLFDSKVEEIVAKYPEILTAPKIVGTNAMSDRSIELQINTVVKPEKQWQFRRSLGNELIKMCKENNIALPGEK